MKKIASILVLVFVFTLTIQGQHKKNNKRPQLTIEQHTGLAVKKMTLALDLSEKQQNQIKPLIMAQATDKRAAMQKRKEYKDSKKKPTSDEIYAMKSKQLDARIAFKKKMKEILKADQFEKFEKMAKHKMQRGKKMKERKMMMKKRKTERENN